ncbi:LPXTG-motif cell wall-anchored protein/fimbrial isopeptide formation D2 family protein [Leucobacter luti]|uniref:SpaH/EbpB family LPXTG-anchored major pilin n=1 Tax=Leucobacter luti TaxID=340320 RepID=UPI00104EB86E|nr:SpaH/EbpB family LPXTG-anchored major pilin [Leucobacter luti]MCW2289461.1 fimbrial isopeptide formation D2 family protein/LPXTG-motif cell wall-anchored protein [Leucobacter luti]TCK40020.1 LPXTG-motif cell wall-anchored protein/fimbrial isopeptide formation D2 family protein [Leucobacter luti]
MNAGNVRRRTTTALIAGALGVAALMGASSAANAAPVEYGNIDTDRQGSITVHKYLHQTGSGPGDISQAPADGEFTDPVAGVGFTAFPLLSAGAPLNLDTTAAWSSLKDLAPGAGCTAPTGFTLGTARALPLTTALGVATISLPVGAYQICETSAPANIIDRATPFIVTIPMPHESGWVYDVHAYPKNGEGVIEKTIEEQQETGLGSVVRFPVTVPVPTSEQTWTGFAIRDTLDARLAPIPAADIAVTVDGAALNPAYFTTTVTGQQITVNFSAAGLAWLNEGPNAHAGKKIQVVFAGTVVALGNGTIENTAELWPNNPTFDPSLQPPIPSNEVETHWGSLAVQKRAAGTTGTEGRLNGAVFEVYNAADPYAADCSTAVAAGAAVTVNGATQFTSAGTGVISVPGLFVSDSVNPVIDAQQRCYVLKEVAAPAGYVVPAQPFTPVTVKIGETTVSDNVEITNTQTEVPELPLTGAAGQAVLIGSGLAAVAAAVALMNWKRRRTATASQR